MENLKKFEDISTRKLHDGLKSGDLTPREITNIYFNSLIDHIQKLGDKVSIDLIKYYMQKLEELSQANKYNL